MMQVFGAGVALAFLLTVPPWPFLNRHPLPWLVKPAAEGGGGGKGEAGGAAAAKKAEKAEQPARRRRCD